MKFLTPSTVRFRKGFWTFLDQCRISPLEFGKLIMTGELDVSEGWVCPDMKFIRNDGTNNAFVMRQVRIFGPKHGTFFSVNKCALIVMIVGEINNSVPVREFPTLPS